MIRLKRDNMVSDHKNWAKMAKCYGWNYQVAKRALINYGEYKGYKLGETPKYVSDVSIPCRKLRMFLATEGLFRLPQSNNFDSYIEGHQEITWNLGLNRTYLAIAEVKNIIKQGVGGSDEYGNQEIIDASDIEITEIISVTSADGENVVLDQVTRERLIKKLEI